MQESEIIQYAPYVLIMVMFCCNYKIFVTPADLERKLEKYVLKETHNVTVDQLKADMAEMKDKLDKIYDKIMNV